MLDPFIQIVADEKGRKLNDRTGKTIAEMYGHSVDTASPQPSMGLWLGRLLIRMGEKLAKQDGSLRTEKEEA